MFRPGVNTALEGQRLPPKFDREFDRAGDYDRDNLIPRCCIIHNICINRGIPFVDEMLVDDSDDEVLS